MNDDTLIEEFKIEAAEMFENAEDGLLNIDKGLDFNLNFNSIFRSFHSLKGAAGMFGMGELQTHMHKLESLFEAQKKYGSMKKGQIDYFLQGIDTAKALIDGGDSNFIHIDVGIFNDEIVANTEVAKPQLIPEKNNKIDRGNGVVFIIDDEPDLIDILSRIIEVDNYIIHKFHNGQDALNAFEEFKPDLLLSDIMMPKMNGIDMIKAIHEISSHTPVVLISGNLSKEKIQEGLKYGAYAFIDKPFNNLSVLNICRNAIKKSQAMQLLEKSITYILYQFSDLDAYLKVQGKENIRITLKAELQIILEQRKIIKEMN